MVCLLQVRKKVQRVAESRARAAAGAAGLCCPPSGCRVCCRGSISCSVLTGVLCGFSTIGAGDTFVAGMLYGLHADAWSREAFAFAVGLATKKVQREGFAGLVP